MFSFDPKTGVKSKEQLHALHGLRELGTQQKGSVDASSLIEATSCPTITSRLRPASLSDDALQMRVPYCSNETEVFATYGTSCLPQHMSLRQTELSEQPVPRGEVLIGEISGKGTRPRMDVVVNEKCRIRSGKNRTMLLRSSRPLTYYVERTSNSAMISTHEVHSAFRLGRNR